VVTRLEQRTFDPLAVDPARLQPRSTASERAQRSTMHLQNAREQAPANVRLCLRAPPTAHVRSDHRPHVVRSRRDPPPHGGHHPPLEWSAHRPPLSRAGHQRGPRVRLRAG